jgi:hypothetical protein
VKRVLLDEGVPRPLKQFLPDFDVRTVQELGLAGRSDAEILQAAKEGGFAIFVTTDKNIQYQQNASLRVIPIYELPTTSWPKLRSRVEEIIAGIKALLPERGDLDILNVDE